MYRSSRDERWVRDERVREREIEACPVLVVLSLIKSEAGRGSSSPGPHPIRSRHFHTTEPTDQTPPQSYASLPSCRSQV
mgnify:CR=1 FL=1